MSDATFHRHTTFDAAAPTLIEGLPGTGLVASIAADHVTEHLGLEQHGTVRSDAFPSVASYADGLVQDTVRVYAGTDPGVMTLQSDVPIPPDAFDGLTQCVVDELAADAGRAIFLAGAPAQSEEQHGDVLGVATTPDVRAELEDAGVDVAADAGAVGGVTGALVTGCYHADVPAALLLVRATPRMPDPGAAHSVIEGALEPLVDFDVDTDDLAEQAEEIQQQKQQVAQQMQQLQNQQDEATQTQSMFQ